MSTVVYLDHLAGTPLDPQVLDAMMPWFTKHFGSPDSQGHAFGWAAEKGVERARAQVADCVGAEPREIVFTSGGAEADNLALKGALPPLANKGRHVVTTAVENHPVRDTLGWLAHGGWEVSVVTPDASGRVAPESLAAACREDTVLVSVQAANPETGVEQPLDEVGALCRERGLVLHCAAEHAPAWTPIDVKATGIHLLSLGGDRIGGPAGAGALFVNARSPRIRVMPQIHGGGQERGMRSGARGVPGIVGLGAAADLARERRSEDRKRVACLRDAFEAALLEACAPALAIGAREHRLPCVSSLAFTGVEGEALVAAIPRLAFATGSACTSSTSQPSHVLRAMGLGGEVVNSAVRLSLGRTTTQDDLDAALTMLRDAVARLRDLGLPPRVPPEPDA